KICACVICCLHDSKNFQILLQTTHHQFHFFKKLILISTFSEFGFEKKNEQSDFIESLPK
ncbi:MAG: hypothetical protein K2H66_02315, partial [Oscillospiraceae bacterium]|nr:hypothetical protein [Oscillospiraceae bacterium]